MRLQRPAAICAALLSSVDAFNLHSHASIARRHMHGHSGLVKRGKCEFPTNAGLVPVTPNEKNAGWAMSPDQPCVPDSYCPYACPPGQLMAQWDPKATTYSYPASMNGGLYCNKNGEIEKPFPKKPYCVDGAGSVGCKNKAGGNIAICQTVLPGNEAMLIPTNVKTTSILAVPRPDYWASTAAHYYINGPGVSVEEGCVWGSKEKPVGNWAPYVAGANEVANGETFVKIGWNPIYLEDNVPFRNTPPSWGVRIECDGKCNGLPCYIDPKEHKVNEISQMNGPGAGGANFCVVTVPKGSTATIVVFNRDGGSSVPEVDIKSPKGDTGGNNIPSKSTTKAASTSTTSTTSSPPPPPSTSTTSKTSYTPTTSTTPTSSSYTTTPTRSAPSILSTSLAPAVTYSETPISYPEWSPTPTPTYSRRPLFGNDTVTYTPTGGIVTPTHNTTVPTSGVPPPHGISSGTALTFSSVTAFILCSIASMLVMAF